jgi:hypothetical protein
MVTFSILLDKLSQGSWKRKVQVGVLKSHGLLSQLKAHREKSYIFKIGHKWRGEAALVLFKAMLMSLPSPLLPPHISFLC